MRELGVHVFDVEGEHASVPGQRTEAFVDGGEGWHHVLGGCDVEVVRVGGVLGDKAHEDKANSLEEPARRVFVSGHNRAGFGGGAFVLR